MPFQVLDADGNVRAVFETRKGCGQYILTYQSEEFTVRKIPWDKVTQKAVRPQSNKMIRPDQDK